MSRRAAAATFAGCRSGITRWRNTACGGATLALCQLRCIAPAGARRRSAMWGALVRQGGATLQRHSVQCSGDQRDHGAWRVTRKGGRRIDRPHRASRSCRRDARAPGVRSRHAGATPAHLARTFTPQPSCGRGRPRTCTFAPLAATGMNFGLHSAEAGASRDTANPDCVHWTGSRGGAEAQEICQFESSYTIRVSSIPISSEC